MVGTTPTARAVGTTVAVKDLFKTLPVRHKVTKGACVCLPMPSALAACIPGTSCDVWPSRGVTPFLMPPND